MEHSLLEAITHIVTLALAFVSVVLLTTILIYQIKKAPK